MDLEKINIFIPESSRNAIATFGQIKRLPPGLTVINKTDTVIEFKVDKFPEATGKLEIKKSEEFKSLTLNVWEAKAYKIVCEVKKAFGLPQIDTETYYDGAVISTFGTDKDGRTIETMMLQPMGERDEYFFCGRGNQKIQTEIHGIGIIMYIDNSWKGVEVGNIFRSYREDGPFRVRCYPCIDTILRITHL